MARNRKRAKERRTRQAQPVASGRERSALDGRQEREQRSEQLADFAAVPLPSSEPEDGAPDPIEHAAPDVELAELQLATASRFEPLPEPDGGDDIAQAEPDADEDMAQAELDPAVTEPRASGPAPSAPVPATQSAVAAPRRWFGARVLAFLEGSWRELQRVQWPDRRQVMQATGVVIGFVVVASAFLGLADLVASKVVHFILNGQF